MICKRCGKESGDRKHCAGCRANIRAANDRFRNKSAPIDHPCKCGTMIAARRHKCDKCLDRDKKAKKAAWNAARYTKPKEEPVTAPKTELQVAIAEAAELRERRANLNPELMLLRVMRGAVMPAVGVMA